MITVLYLEDEQIETDQPTSIVIYVQNTTKISQQISNVIDTYPVQDLADGDVPSAVKESTTPTSAAADQAPLHLAVAFRGAFDEPIRPITDQVSSLRVESISLEPGSSRLLRKTIIGRFRPGKYTVQATLTRGQEVIEKSKPKVLSVIDPTN